MVRKPVYLGVTIVCGATLALASFVHAQDRLPRECRQQVRQLCGADRANIRECLKQKAGELSDTCRSEPLSRIGEARGERRDGTGRGGNAPADGQRQIFSYGTDALQNADFWAGKGERAPLVLFVHGGGWKRGDKQMMTGSAKLSHWQAQGYAVASVNYRLVPANTVEDQAADVASAVAYFRKNASRLKIDPARIVLIGHSAGAHLVSLVGTDPQWLRGQGLAMTDIAGVVALDGAGYLVPDQMDENARLMGDTYQQAFGTDPARQLALSPTHHAAAPNAPAFLILHVERDDAERQSKGLADRLAKAGTPAQLHGLKGRGLIGHMEINRDLGKADYPATPLVDEFLKRTF